MVGSETGWAKQKRDQREKQKLLSGQCPPNSPPEIDIDKELDIEIDEDLENNELNDGLDLISLKLNKTNLVQKETTKYNAIFIQKKIYFENSEYLPESVLTQIKLYQLAVKRLYDNKQGELLEKVTLPILEKVFGNILKNKNIENIIESKAKELNMTITKFIVSSCLKDKIVIINGLDKVDTELRRIGNNINQLTKLANEKIITVIDLKELRMEVNNIWQLLKQLVQKQT